ncbi:MAG TPA: Ig-like domain-containing protein, partial [Candidatus Paceibacterota bacterium]|nr:Ig-like domain-containing protein [Candidatus Paceibacterota bacterium]
VVQGSHARILIAAPFRADRVDVFLGRAGTSIPLGTAFSVGPLMDGTYYGYAKDWDTTQNQDGEYAILARAYKSSTEMIPTDAFPVYVRNSSTATVSTATTTIVKTTTTATNTGTVTTTTTTTTGGTATTQTTSSTGSTATAPKVTTTTTLTPPTTTVFPKPAPTPISATTSTSLSNTEDPPEFPVDVFRVCSTRESCKTFCEENSDRIAECRDFARAAIIAELPRGSEIRSITETLPEEVRESVTTLLAEPATRPVGIPEEVRDTHTFAQYCSDPDHEALCGRVLIDNRVLSEDEFASRAAEVKIARDEQRKILSERVGSRAFTDSDGDGITDYDEINLYGADPRDADTDNDGIRDGDEIMAGTNPAAMPTVAATGTPVMATGSSQTTLAMPSPEEIRFENPKLAGVKTPELLAVQKVDVAEKETLPDGTERVKSLALAGQAPPNSFVRIFMFSEPIMVTVKAGDDGIWTYTFDKELSDGQHEVYTAITDVSGKIVAKSSPTAFVKTANAVSIVPAETLLAATPAPETASPSFFSGTSLYALIAVGIGIVGIAISVIGFAVRRKDDVDMGGPTVLPPASA